MPIVTFINRNLAVCQWCKLISFSKYNFKKQINKVMPANETLYAMLELVFSCNVFSRAEGTPINTKQQPFYKKHVYKKIHSP